MKLLRHIKTQPPGKSALSLLWLGLFLFPLMSACTTVMNDQLLDTTQLAETQGKDGASADSNKPADDDKTAVADDKTTVAIADGAAQKNKDRTAKDTSESGVTKTAERADTPSDAADAKAAETQQPTSLLAFLANKKAESKLITPSQQDGTNANNASEPAKVDTKTTDAKIESKPVVADLPAGKPASPQSTAQNTSESTGLATKRAQSQQKGTLLRLFSGDQSTKLDKKKVQNEQDNKQAKAEQKVASVQTQKPDLSEYNDVLPGVRPNGGIEIKHRTSLYDDTDIDANEDDLFPSYQNASLGSMARSLPNGLRIARKEVQVGCLKPQLVTLLKQVERRFGKPVVITSGYRNPSHNRKVNGAKRSLHMSCAAADIIIAGVNKWEVAKYVRSLPGRGGVGTYCHQAIHVDVGPKRDWNWSCTAKR